MFRHILFLTLFLLGVNTAHADPIFYISHGEEEKVTGAIPFPVAEEHELTSNRQLEIVFSPVERVSYLNGHIVSYTYFKQDKYPQRAKLSKEYGFQVAILPWELSGNVFFRFSHDTKSPEIVSIDGIKAQISYEKGDYQLKVTEKQ